jgi:hypothetical protein
MARTATGEILLGLDAQTVQRLKDAQLVYFPTAPGTVGTGIWLCYGTTNEEVLALMHELIGPTADILVAP